MLPVKKVLSEIYGESSSVKNNSEIQRRILVVKIVMAYK